MSRSFLFVPGDSERKLGKALDSGADAIIVDLEDAVAAGARPAARKLARAFLEQEASADLWVRINPLNTSDAMQDLRTVMPAAPTGIVLPKAEGGDDMRRLDKVLGEIEREHGIGTGQTQILPIVTETAGALFKLQEYIGCSVRLAGMSWGAEDLSSAIGASVARDDDGHWLPPYEMARSLCLFAAAAAGVAAIDTVFTRYKDEQGLLDYVTRARRDGFTGMLAIHPAQLAVINEAFTPGRAEIARAERIVALFADNPDAGTLGMDGEMIDRPHQLQAERLLALARKHKVQDPD